ncbi:hypothetical protein ACLMJK_001443 [Lecanora helva]
MAPLDFENSVDVASLAGTWLGTMFTGVGLLAVLTQLRSLIMYVTEENRRWKERAAGAWASCILVDQLPSNGIQEGVIPLFSGWLQAFYVQEESIATTQDERGEPGKGSWTKLFARLDIKAADLVACGNSAQQRAPPRRQEYKDGELWVRPLRQGLGDALFENGSVSYGLSAAEFAALVILCGFCPKDFSPQSSGQSKGYFGQMLIANHGPFSQVAKFDSHHAFCDAINIANTGLRNIPVAHSLQLAFGMVSIQGRGTRKWVILSQREDFQSDNPFPHNIRTAALLIWGEYALPQQLRKLLYTFECLVGISELTIGEYSQADEAFEADDLLTLRNLRAASNPVKPYQVLGDERIPNFAALVRATLNSTHAVAAIQPWALLPVIPSRMAVAFRSILEPFYRTREHTVQMLRVKLARIPETTFHLRGGTAEQRSRELGGIGGDRDGFFGGHSNKASAYYEAMSLVFEYEGISLADTRIQLAAAVGAKLFWQEDLAEESNDFQRSLTRYLERCYLGAETVEKPSKVPDWAIDIYANYLWGWITDSIEADLNIIDYFRRRVFLA